MKKITAIILTFAFLVSLTACDNYESLPDSGDSSFVDSSDIEDIGDSEASDNSDEDTDSEPEEITPPIPVEFTEEDRELEAMLSDLQAPAQEIYSWLTSGGGDGSVEYWFRFPDIDETRTYRYNPFSGSVFYLFEADPSTCAEMETLMLRFFSADRTERFMNKYFSVYSAEENDDGTYTLKLKEGKTSSYPATFIEIDGKLYRNEGIRTTSILFFDGSVKVVSKTDDTIEFTYLNDHWAFTEENLGYLNDAELYSENADHGTLKYERGGWKIDYLEYPFTE